jgi:serine/threonine protein kinase
MELLDGFTSLDKYTNPADIPLPVEQIAISLLDRLESVHAAGFVHVDIHKRNIMVDGETGEVDLIDFGLAVKITEHKSPAFVNLYLSSTVEQARSPLYPVDDIERLVFVLLDCFYGPLPWISMMRMRESLDKKLREGPEVLALAAALEKRIWAAKSKLFADDEFFASRSIHPGFRRVLEYIEQTAEMRKSESFPIDYNLLRSYFRDPADLPTDALTESLAQVKIVPSVLPIKEDDKV